MSSLMNQPPVIVLRALPESLIDGTNCWRCTEKTDGQLPLIALRNELHTTKAHAC
jgi:hypothetical protein